MPKRTAVDRRVRALCVELARVTGSELMQWHLGYGAGPRYDQEEYGIG
jgi:hypothetical protein